jgi:hypothetical protein
LPGYEKGNPGKIPGELFSRSLPGTLGGGMFSGTRFLHTMISGARFRVKLTVCRCIGWGAAAVAYTATKMYTCDDLWRARDEDVHVTKMYTCDDLWRARDEDKHVC